MREDWLSRWLLFGVVLTALAVDVALIYGDQMEWAEAWIPLLLLSLASYSLLAGHTPTADLILAILLTSVSVLVTGSIPGETLSAFPDWFGSLGDSLWTALVLLIPFTFLHFALRFPVRQAWPGRWFGWCLYVLWLLTVVALQIPALSGAADRLTPWLFPGGILAGIVIFVWQYRFSLTAAEKNRLRLILLGCAAGVVPRLLYLLTAHRLPVPLGDLTILLFPVFPVMLLIAVHRRDLSGTGFWLGRFVPWMLLGSVVLAGYMLTFVAVSLALPTDDSTWAVHLLAAAGSLLGVGLPGYRVLVNSQADLFGWRSRRPRIGRGGPTKAFSPIHPNPFIVGNPIRSADMFFGREAEFHFIERTLRQRAEGCVIVLSGERRTGKTSILFQLHEGRLGDDFIPVFFDMQGFIVENAVEFLWSFGEEISRATGCEFAASGQGSDRFSVQEFIRFLEPVFQKLGPRRLLLLIDEYELIQERIERGVLPIEIPRILASLLERFQGLSLVLTGSHDFEEGQVWEALAGKACHREISFLARSDAEALLADTLRGKATFELDAMADLFRLTHGHPFYTQLLGQNLVEVLNERQSSLVTPQVVEEVTKRVVRNPPPQLLYTWSGFSSEQKLTLSALAASASSPVEFSPWSSVEETLASVVPIDIVSLGANRVRIELESLRRQYVLDRDQDRYRFTIDLMRHWIRIERSPWSVLSEIRATA